VLVERGAGTKTVATLLGFIQPLQEAQIQADTQIFGSEWAEKLKALSSDRTTVASLARMPSRVQGLAIPSMQFVDGCLLFTMLLMGLALLLPQHVHAKVQGAITQIFSIVLVITGIAQIFTVLIRLILMVALLFSFPFGTLIYLVVYGHFPRAAMTAMLGGLFLLRILFVVFLLLAHQDFLKNIGLIVYAAVAFIAGLVVSFLYGLVPGILVSITDAIAAIVVSIIGIVLGVVLVIQSVPAIVITAKSLLRAPVPT
jgi:hypothetical protein